MDRVPKPPTTIKESSTDEEKIMAQFRAEVNTYFLSVNNIFSSRYGPTFSFSPRELTMADAIMWERVKNYTKGSVSPADLEEYRKNVEQNRNPSRTELKLDIIKKLVAFWIQEKNTERVKEEKEDQRKKTSGKYKRKHDKLKNRGKKNE